MNSKTQKLLKTPIRFSYFIPNDSFLKSIKDNDSIVEISNCVWPQELEIPWIYGLMEIQKK